MRRKSLGSYGEALAAQFLEAHGYEIVTRNWRYGRYGEIDIIAYALPKQVLAFVEVKTRTSLLYGNPLEAITLQKQQTIRLLAEAYLAQLSPEHYPYRAITLDLITVMLNPREKEKNPVIQFYPAAF